MIKKIGVLTSGGDAPGMNAAIRAIVRAGLEANLEMYVIYYGYKGIIDRNIVKVDRKFVADIIDRGGTKIGTARLPEFKEDAVQQKAADILGEYGIDALVTIGGDGTYMGALALSRKGIKCVAIPGTIDNDVASTDYTIGFATALQTVVDCIDKLRDTSSSHLRCSVIEVMGRYCGDLAVYASLASGADLVVTRENPMTEEEILEEVRKQKNMGKHHIMVLITEKILNVHQLADKITVQCGIEAKSEVLGRIQRGGTPVALDRYLASTMGVYSVDTLLAGKTGVCVGIINNELTATPIEEALKMTNKSNKEIKTMLHRTR